MKNVLDNIEEACKIIQEFYAILGPDLAQITGSSDDIDIENAKVKDEVRKLETFSFDVFNIKHQTRWEETFAQFKTNIVLIDGRVVTLIDKTFSGRQLNSSEGAFDLLSKF